jgi:hypothetical protein
MRLKLHLSMIGLAVVVLMWGLTAWAASDDSCKSGPDECTWTNMQWIAHGLVPVLFLVALGWFLIALVRAVTGIDNRSS